MNHGVPDSLTDFTELTLWQVGKFIDGARITET